MKRIYNELEYAENLLKNGFTNYITRFDLGILAKYYRYIEKLNKEQIRKKINEFCSVHEKTFNEIIEYNKINNAIKYSKKHNLKIFRDISITKNEVEKIKELNNYRYEKVIFTMLVLAKYEKMNSSRIDNLYYCDLKHPAIFREAKVVQKKDENIRNVLYNGKYTEDGKYGYLILFTNSDDKSETEILVTSLEDITLFWKPRCKRCGVEIERTSTRQELCKNCYKIIEKERLHKLYMDSRIDKQKYNSDKEIVDEKIQ